MTSTDRATRTPSPWTVYQFRYDIERKDDNGACGDPECCGATEYHANDADTEFIVRSANAHDALVEALERIVSNSEDATAVEVAAAALQGLPTSYDRATAEE